MSISDMIVVMKEGVVQQMGKPQEVYDDPVNLFVAKFLGTPPINLFSGRVEAGKLWIGKEPVLAVGDMKNGDVTVGIRPEGFVPKADGAFGCSLSGVEVMGRDISVVSTHEASQNPTIRAIIDAEEMPDASAAEVRFILKPSKVLLFDNQTGERIYV